MTKNIPALIAEARERHRRTARHLPDPTSPTLVSRLADALESLSAPSGDDREVLMSDLIPDVLALVERIGNHVAAEYGEDPALDDMILQLRTSQPVQVEVTERWPSHWTIDDKLSDLHARYHEQSGNMLGRDECGWERCDFWVPAEFALTAALGGGDHE